MNQINSYSLNCIEFLSIFIIYPQNIRELTFEWKQVNLLFSYLICKNTMNMQVKKPYSGSNKSCRILSLIIILQLLLCMINVIINFIDGLLSFLEFIFQLNNIELKVVFIHLLFRLLAEIRREFGSVEI